MKHPLKQERILLSAIIYDDGNFYPLQPSGIDTGLVITGRRHKDCYNTLRCILLSLVSVNLHDQQMMTYKHMESKITRQHQGFITNYNKYVNRTQAMVIAKEANQLINPQLHQSSDSELTSEDLFFDARD